MGFLSTIQNFTDKSVFTKQSISHAIYGSGGKDAPNGFAILKITPKENPFTGRQDKSIVGVMQEAISFGIEAKWNEGGTFGEMTSIPGLSDLFNVDGAVANFVNPALNAAGLSVGAAFSTRKIYQSSGFLILSAKIRVVDWEGMGQPLNVAKLLASYCIPTLATGSGLKEIQQGLDTIGNGAKKLLQISEEAVEKIVTDLTENDPTASTLAQMGSDAYHVGKAIAAQTTEGLSDAATLRASPMPVILTIGEYFKHDDMVITNVQFDFSKDVTEAGPLFVDATISFSSRFIITDKTKIGIHSTKAPRVTVADAVGL